LGKKFHDLLQLTKLLTVLSVYAAEAEAISSCGVLAQAVTAQVAKRGLSAIVCFA